MQSLLNNILLLQYGFTFRQASRKSGNAISDIEGTASQPSGIEIRYSAEQEQKTRS